MINAKGGNRHGDPLGAAQRLRKDQHAEQDVDQRVDVIPERSFHRAAGIHRPDVHRPVGRDQNTGKRQPLEV
jgi:hypothetical protein